MTYYTLPKLFKNSTDNILNKLIFYIQDKQNIKNDSLLEKFLNTLITDENRNKYEEIKALYSFTDLLNMKLSDEIYHPKSYFAFIEISKICNIFDKQHLRSLHMSETYDYLDALYQIRKDRDTFIYLSENYHVNTPDYIKCENINNNDVSSINKFVSHYRKSIDLISINSDDMNKTLLYLLIAILSQKMGGKLILKIKRLNSYISKEITYLLMSLYENVMIIKPKIVNSVNEYKYIVASNLTVNIDYPHYDAIFKNMI